MLRIENHRLIGDGVSFRATPNCGGELKARFLVFHYTAGRSADSSVESLCTRKPQGNASAHLVVSRDGRIVQLAPFNIVTWHAGVSQWNGLVGLNRASIGIEMDNAGWLNRVGDKFIAWFGKEYGAGDVMLAEHKHGGGTRPWHVYTEVQIERAHELAKLLVDTTDCRTCSATKTSRADASRILGPRFRWRRSPAARSVATRPRWRFSAAR